MRASPWPARVLGGDVALMVDANGAYTRKQALAARRGVRRATRVTWFEEPVSSDDREGLRLLRDRAPAGMAIAAGEYGYDAMVLSATCSAAGAVDVLQADATRCLRLHRIPAGRGPVLRPLHPALGPLRPPHPRPPVLRHPRRAARRVLPRPSADRSASVRRVPVMPRRGAAPGSRAARAGASSSRGTTRERTQYACEEPKPWTCVADVDSTAHEAAAIDPRLGRSGASSHSASPTSCAARFASTPAAGPVRDRRLELSAVPRSASSAARRRRRGAGGRGVPGGTARRCSVAAAAPASPDSAATSAWCSTSPST